MPGREVKKTKEQKLIRLFRLCGKFFFLASGGGGLNPLAGINADALDFRTALLHNIFK
jgi:hypothetical protein